MARSDRFPQPRPQADPVQAKHAHPASAGEALTQI
jgi:hypothetical protein